eukprot:scaffold3726_cov270-Pinguiococcus_pyrenoidosus.AAC.8
MSCLVLRTMRFVQKKNQLVLMLLLARSSQSVAPRSSTSAALAQAQPSGRFPVVPCVASRAEGGGA